MVKTYAYLSYIFLLSCLLSGSLQAYAWSNPPSKQDSTAQKGFRSRISDLSNASGNQLLFAFKPFSPTSSPSRTGAESDKILSNVKVFPNQVSDQVSLSFKLNKDSNVSVKIMDALGNELSTLLSQQRLSAGEQNNTFSISNKLNQGYYFIRVIAGTETVVKRIEVL
jgi:hypothetical protein